MNFLFGQENVYRMEISVTFVQMHCIAFIRYGAIMLDFLSTWSRIGVVYLRPLPSSRSSMMQVWSRDLAQTSLSNLGQGAVQSTIQDRKENSVAVENTFQLPWERQRLSNSDGEGSVLRKAVIFQVKSRRIICKKHIMMLRKTAVCCVHTIYVSIY